MLKRTRSNDFNAPSAMEGPASQQTTVWFNYLRAAVGGIENKKLIASILFITASLKLFIQINLVSFGQGGIQICDTQ